MIHIVPVSGGKDSQLVLRRIVDAHSTKDVRAVHQYTGFDHSATYAHLDYMEKRYGVKIEYTTSEKRRDMQGFLIGAGYFPSSSARGCTKELKIEPFIKWLLANDFGHAGRAHVYMGMRSGESAARGNKYGDVSPLDVFSYADLSTGASHKKKGLESIAASLPIVDLTTEQVFAELKACGDEVNALYKRGHSRVGCYPCLLSKREEWELAMQDPEGVKHIDLLLDIENKFKRDKNPRKLIKIHESRDVAYLRANGRFPEHQRRGLDEAPGCAICDI